MARTNTLGNFLTDVADAIREKKGTSDAIQASNFDTEIANLPSGGGLDWSAIGYQDTPQSITNGYNYAAQIQNNWDATANLNQRFYTNLDIMFMPLVDTSIGGSANEMFYGCKRLLSIPLLDFSNVTSMNSTFANCINLTDVALLNTENVTDFSSAFNGCNRLETIPLFDTSKCTKFSGLFGGCLNLKNVPILDTSKIMVNGFNNMFMSCQSLTTQSLDNILQMCIGATSYSGTKTLVKLSLSSTYYPAGTIQALPHYQDFINAGWTIGY